MQSTIPDQALFGFAIPPHPRGPKRTKDSKVAHGSRPEMPKGSVAHVTIKLKAGLPSLRKGEALAVVRAAIERVNAGKKIRIVEYSIQSNHVHLIVEAANSADLSAGMASLNTGLGMRLNRVWDRVGQGSVFAERFHLVLVSSPPQMRRALNYVLRNDVHHRLHLKGLDPCSSAPAFAGWEQLQGIASKARTAAAAKRCVSTKPQTWLLRVGWQQVKGAEGLLSTEQWPSIARVRALEC